MTTSFRSSNGPVSKPKAIDAQYHSTPLEDFGIIKLYPTQMRFVNGIARAYDDEYPIELEPFVTPQDFETAINQINNTMKDYWPCFFCICCGYTCCPITLGISLLCPNLCIKDAEQYVRALIHRINRRDCFTSVGVEWMLVRTCGRSWIEITYPLTKKPIMETYQSKLPIVTMDLHSTNTKTTLSSTNSKQTTAESPLIIDV